MAEVITYRSADHPKAPGSTPGQEYAVLFELDDGRELVIEFGEKSHQALREVLRLAPKVKRQEKQPAK